MLVFRLHIYLCTTYMSGLWRSEEDVGFPGTELQLLTAVSVMGTKPGSSARAARGLNHWAISPALYSHSFVCSKGRRETLAYFYSSVRVFCCHVCPCVVCMQMSIEFKRLSEPQTGVSCHVNRDHLEERPFIFATNPLTNGKKHIM